MADSDNPNLPAVQGSRDLALFGAEHGGTLARADLSNKFPTLLRALNSTLSDHKFNHNSTAVFPVQSLEIVMIPGQDAPVIKTTTRTVPEYLVKIQITPTDSKVSGFAIGVAKLLEYVKLDEQREPVGVHDKLTSSGYLWTLDQLQTLVAQMYQGKQASVAIRILGRFREGENKLNDVNMSFEKLTQEDIEGYANCTIDPDTRATFVVRVAGQRLPVLWISVWAEYRVMSAVRDRSAMKAYCRVQGICFYGKGPDMEQALELVEHLFRSIPDSLRNDNPFGSEASNMPIEPPEGKT